MERTAVAYLGASQARLNDASAAPYDLRIVAAFGDEDGERRSGLGRALSAIVSGQADTLFLARCNDAAGSLGELVRLLDWLQAADADLVAADVSLDTGSRGGRRSAALVWEIDRWSRHPAPAGRPRGRPGLSAGSPALAERIAALRERGLSLQAIAAALEAEGVPTPRGGERWRASSVQSVLGYRRPRPPMPGAPPPPPGPRGHAVGPPHGPTAPKSPRGRRKQGRQP